MTPEQLLLLLGASVPVLAGVNALLQAATNRRTARATEAANATKVLVEANTSTIATLNTLIGTLQGELARKDHDLAEEKALNIALSNELDKCRRQHRERPIRP